jgi:hypothetical protein
LEQFFDDLFYIFIIFYKIEEFFFKTHKLFHQSFQFQKLS